MESFPFDIDIQDPVVQGRCHRERDFGLLFSLKHSFISPRLSFYINVYMKVTLSKIVFPPDTSQTYFCTQHLSPSNIYLLIFLESQTSTSCVGTLVFSCINFLLLVWLVTTNIAFSNENLLFCSLVSWKSNTGLSGLKSRCWQGCAPFGSF